VTLGKDEEIFIPVFADRENYITKEIKKLRKIENN
jgi:hypothetical protein